MPTTGQAHVCRLCGRPERGVTGGGGEEERQGRAQVLTARKVERKQAVLWMQFQRDAQVAACVDNTSRTVEVLRPTRQVLYVGEMVRQSKGTAADWDPDTDMPRVRKGMAIADYEGARGGPKGHTIQVVFQQASASVTDLVQDGQTWWVLGPTGHRRAAIVCAAATLERIEDPLMRWVGWAKEVRGETEGEVHMAAILRALELQRGRSAEEGEAEDIKEQIRMAVLWVTSCKEVDQPRWIVPPGTEEGARQGALAGTRRIMEDAKGNGPEVENEPEAERQGRWRGLSRRRGGQMQFVLEDGGEDGPRNREEAQVQDAGGRELRQEENSQVGQVEQGDGARVPADEGAAVDVHQESCSGEGGREQRQNCGEEAGDSGAGNRGKHALERLVGGGELQRGADAGRLRRKGGGELR